MSPSGIVKKTLALVHKLGAHVISNDLEMSFSSNTSAEILAWA